MKNLGLFFILTLSLFSCSNDDENSNVTTKHITISNTETYTYNLGVAGFGFFDGAKIGQQTEHFEISEINRNATMVYTYKPEADFVGEDFVRLEVVSNSDINEFGPSFGNVSEIVEINFTVTP